MDKGEVISSEHSVHGVGKSYNNLHLSEHTEQCGSAADNGSVTHINCAVASSAPAAVDVSGKSSIAEDRSLSGAGASSEPTVPAQDGAGEPDSTNMMTKVMMMMMSNGESHSTPGTSGTPASSVPDTMSMLTGNGMPFPDMMSMMAKGGMPAMMNKGAMKGGPIEMAHIFNCIIDMSLARANSDDSEEDEDSAVAELPCQYCCRFFASQMALKTHILVAHEQEDDSVLNLTQLTLDSNGKPMQASQLCRKCSRDTEVFASGLSVKTAGRLSRSGSVSPHADLAASESVRGVKRGRTESRDLEATQTGGASGVEDLTGEHDQTCSSSQLETGAVPEVIETFDTFNKSVLGQHSQRTPMESVSQSRPKKSKTKRSNLESCPGDEDKSQSRDSATMKSCTLKSSEDVGNKNLMSDAKNGSSQSRQRGTQGLQAAAAAGPSKSPTSARRCLRSHKSHY
ncbi:uncharacterized protein LOC143280771 [Babylonia areolata]|uniref:uncharacterized protein LOC143280771 n=1 Tax=Babylonia areolata TaxID=304850 RepID=UPI003FCF92EC